MAGTGTTVRLPLRYFKEHSRNGVLESSNTPAPYQAKPKFDSHPQFQTILTLPSFPHFLREKTE